MSARLPLSARLSVERILNAMAFEQSLIKTRKRNSAIKKLAAIPQPDVVLGLMLDFSTDLRCENASYLGVAHGEPVEVVCQENPPHTVCGRCADQACTNDCDATPCPMCDGLRLRCEECADEFRICKKGGCERAAFECCEESGAKPPVLCHRCIDNCPSCAVCDTLLCGECNDDITCRSDKCVHTVHACAEHMDDALDRLGWLRCDGCNEFECEQCRGDENDAYGTKCACGADLCQECRREEHCEEDKRIEEVKRRKRARVVARA